MGRPTKLYGIFDHSRPYGIHVDIQHDFDEVGIGFDDGGFKAVHNHLTLSFHSPVEGSSKEGIDESEEIGEEASVLAKACEVGMIRHEAEVVDLDTVLRGIFLDELEVMDFGSRRLE